RPDGPAAKALTDRLPRRGAAVCRPSVSCMQSIATRGQEQRRFPMKPSILAIAAIAALACATGAQAHLLASDAAGASAKTLSGQSVLALMTKAGIHYHAAANYLNEQRLYGSGHSVSSSGVRPDNRPGPRGI